MAIKMTQLEVGSWGYPSETADWISMLPPDLCSWRLRIHSQKPSSLDPSLAPSICAMKLSLEEWNFPVIGRFKLACHWRIEIRLSLVDWILKFACHWRIEIRLSLVDWNSPVIGRLKSACHWRIEIRLSLVDWNSPVIGGLKSVCHWWI